MKTKARDLNFTLMNFLIMCNGHADSLGVKNRWNKKFHPRSQGVNFYFRYAKSHGASRATLPPPRWFSRNYVFLAWRLILVTKVHRELFKPLFNKFIYLKFCLPFLYLILTFAGFFSPWSRNFLKPANFSKKWKKTIFKRLRFIRKTD